MDVQGMTTQRATGPVDQDDISKTLRGDEKKKELQQYTLKDISSHWDSKSCWLVLYDYVYDVTEFIQEHPGGMEIIMEHSGGDGTSAFKDKRHSAEAIEMLEQYLIGQLVQEERIYDVDKRL